MQAQTRRVAVIGGNRIPFARSNTVYADADGRIAYWHPGLFPVRSSSWDSRFPAPGTGEHDRRGFVPFERMPHVVDPEQGALVTVVAKVGQLDESATVARIDLTVKLGDDTVLGKAQVRVALG